MSADAVGSAQASTGSLFRQGLAPLLEGYRTGCLTPADVLNDLAAQIDDADPAVLIYKVSPEHLQARAAELEAQSNGPQRLALYGVPFVVKDNIDVAGYPTTAASKAFARLPTKSAPAVRELEAAGAVLVGKANLDQFATGLVGTRSPYGIPRNPRAPEHVPGGSSSGSAVAVASGLAAFALGTDTAGSGRVPAAMNGIIGAKPTRGLVSTRGVVPACPSLDCISVFANNARDAALVIDLIDRFDPEDPWTRPARERRRAPADALGALRLGVPRLEGLDDRIDAAFRRQSHELAALVADVVPIDLTPFERAGSLLYQGPWIAERMAAIEGLPGADAGMLPTIREVLSAGSDWSAADAFRAQHELAELARDVNAVFAHVDVIVVPSVPFLATLEAVAREPIDVNARLGRFTNFVNLLDLSAVAMPSGTIEGVPVGVTLIAPALQDRTLLALAGAHAGLSPETPTGPESLPRLAVVGAHLRGQPLHHELANAGARLVQRTTTAPDYRLFHLAESTPPKPGLVPAEDGSAIDVEVYELSPGALTEIRGRVRAPLAISPIRLADGSWVDGFMCTAEGVVNSHDITEFGGWRAYLAHGW